MKKEESTQSFAPPRHWIGPEELESGYWSDPKTLERRAQEFHDKPIETVSMIERMDTKGIARRDFLTIMSASMAMAGFACARRPVHKIIPYVIAPEDMTLGVANYYASTCPDTGAGLLIKTREGRPIKLEGNPSHPINQGALTARGQAAILDLYDAERLKAPVARVSGMSSAVSWSDADTAIQAKLRSAGGKVRVLTGSVRGESTRRLIQDFLGSSSGHVEFEPLSLEEINESQLLCYGAAVQPTYHFNKAEVVVSLGADFLGNWLSPLEHARQWAETRKLDAKNAAGAKLSRLITFEPTLTVTGAASDERFSLRPGDEIKVALFLARELGAQFSAASGYTAEAVASELGVDASKLKAVAHALSQAKGKSLVVGGSVQTKSKDALALQIAINFINSALGNDGVTVDGSGEVDAHPASSYSRLEHLIAEMNAGAVDVLIIQGSNPVYTLPKAAGFAQALSKVGLVVAIADREDETARLANYILPDHHFLENWGDAHPRRSVYSLQQPAIAPIHSTRAFQESLLTWIKGAGLKGSALSKSESWHDYLSANWRETVYKEAGRGTSFEKFWENALRDGVVDTAAGKVRVGGSRSFKAGALSGMPAFASNHAGLTLALYAHTSQYDGRSSNNAWLQEMPDPISTVTWDNYLNVGPSTAKGLGISQDDVVEISVGAIKFELPVNIQPGMHASAVSCAIGYGRRNAGKIGDGAGVDLYPAVNVANGRLIYAGAEVSLRKTGKFYRLAAVQWHHASENRPIINDISLASFRKDPESTSHTNPELRAEDQRTIWSTHEYKGYRWGMAIDLNACTGCGACVIGCQAENNIPVVGRTNVRVSRQMHWIRLDRYYTSTFTGSDDQPDVVFQPMLCQHCENAPCETVCPVLATVHDNEGTSNQAYNRCVGTRYCQNNCPYKVRRFNFFDHWKTYQGEMNLVWNPDVTVRTRGIMEKCSFCIQRINGGKDKAKDEGRRVTDGDIKTACQQTCPTSAIVFGNVNDPKSRVSQLKGDARAFKALEVLNTKPSISYLTKVRNKEGHPHG